MSFLTQWFGKKDEAANGEAQAALEDLVHKAEQAFPESPKVAMRLIERRAPAVVRVTDYGLPGHVVFAELVMKAIRLKRAGSQPEFPVSAAADLPQAACYREPELRDLDELAGMVRQQTDPLVYVHYPREWSEGSTVLLGIEAQVIFATNPSALVVFTTPEDFMARREWLLEFAEAAGQGVKTGELPEALAFYLNRQEGIHEETGYLTDFGYPVTFYCRED